MVTTAAEARLSLAAGESVHHRVPAEGFSARWSGFLDVRETGSYSFTANKGASGSEGFKIILDGKTVADAWGTNSATTTSDVVLLDASKLHPIQILYSEFGPGANTFSASVCFSAVMQRCRIRPESAQLPDTIRVRAQPTPSVLPTNWNDVFAINSTHRRATGLLQVRLPRPPTPKKHGFHCEMCKTH